VPDQAVRAEHMPLPMLVKVQPGWRLLQGSQTKYCIPVNPSEADASFTCSLTTVCRDDYVARPPQTMGIPAV
jgi:hypothetical protein